MRKLNNSEAVYSFAAWLTTRKEVIVVGSNHDCAPIAELVKNFCEANKLDEVREDFGKAHVVNPEEHVPC